MNIIEEILAHNTEFVKNGIWSKFGTTKYPNKKLAILSCMDTRLTELIPAALNIKNGDVKIIKNAGAIISHPYGSVMRSLLVAVYELGVTDIMVLGHTDCGMESLDTNKLIQKMSDRNVPSENIASVADKGVDIHKWLRGFDNVDDSVKHTVAIIRDHLLMPHDINVHGFVIDINTGKLTQIN